MAKKNNKPAAPAAPATPAAETKETNVPATSAAQQNAVQVISMTDFMNNMSNVQATETSGMDPNRRVDLLRIMHETFRMDPKAAERNHMSQDTVDKINHITALGQLAALSCEITLAKNPFAIIMNKSQIDMINQIGSEVGLSIDTKALPAPDADGGIKLIAGKDINVNKEAQEKIVSETKTAEAAIQKNPDLDPTKVQNEDELKEAIVAILVKELNGYAKISNSINFLRSYLSFKNKDNAEELEKVKKMSNKDLLVMIKDLVGPCPYVLNGMGHHLFVQTGLHKSPISAFCAFRNTTKNKKTGAYNLSDQEVADYVSILVTWSAESVIAKETDNIAKYESDILVLKKDAKKNAKGIEDLVKKIETKNNAIAHYKEVLNYISEVSSDVPDGLIEGYKGKDQNAMRLFKAICDSYYDDLDLKTVEPGGVYNNVAQYAGIIHNLFRETMSPLEGYSIANLVDLVPVQESEETTEEEKKEDDSKK